MSCVTADSPYQESEIIQMSCVAAGWLFHTRDLKSFKYTTPLLVVLASDGAICFGFGFS